MNKIFFGQTIDGNTSVIGKEGSSKISKIYIDGSKQMAPNEFRFNLNRFGNVNSTKFSDYQKGIKDLCGID